MSTLRAICDARERERSLGTVYLLEDGVQVEKKFAAVCFAPSTISISKDIAREIESVETGRKRERERKS